MRIVFNPDTSGLSATVGKAVRAVESPGGGMRDGFTQASALYLGFIRRRFVDQSRGAGEWPDLAPSTKYQRARKTKAGRAKYDKAKKKAKGQSAILKAGGFKFAILRDTSTLLNSLSTGAPGSIAEFLPDGVRVGTAIKYAKYHQTGGPHLPKRTILVPPDAQTSDRIKTVLTQAVLKSMKEK